MFHLRRSVLLVVLTSAGIAYARPSAAQPTQAKAQIPARAIPVTPDRLPPPAPTRPSATSARAHRAGGPNKAVLRDSPRSAQKSDKARSSSADRSRQVNDVLLNHTPPAQPRRKGRLGTIAAKVRAATTGNGKGDTDSKWSRTKETSAP